ncbi:MAG: hypothetical protein U5J64_02710 [Halobacteriales archaeon]|nr:hypothetical protein [Halobacteriales archaeon]
MADHHTSGYRPRRFIRDVSTTPTPQEAPVLHMVKCPFCRVHVGGEQNFREHLHKECEEAPREVNHDVTDWRDELEEFEDEPEDTSEEEESRSRYDRPDDAPGEVLPV